MVNKVAFWRIVNCNCMAELDGDHETLDVVCVGVSGTKLYDVYLIRRIAKFL